MDAFDLVIALPDLTKRTFKTPGAGASGKPFTVRGHDLEGVQVKTSRGGTVMLRSEAFDRCLRHQERCHGRDRGQRTDDKQRGRCQPVKVPDTSRQGNTTAVRLP